MGSIARSTAALLAPVLAATGGLVMVAAGAPAQAVAAQATGQAGHAGAAGQAGAAGRAVTGGHQRLRDIGGPRMAGRGIVVNYPSRRSRRLPSVPSSAYVIANARTGQVLAARDPHGLFPPASTLKVLTAITMIPLLNPRASVLATSLAAAVEPNVVGLVPGRRYRVADLFRALLLISANDAAVALAQAAGSLRKGIALMNAQARRLRAYDVVARQPNGLPAAGQVVSAYDLALIARQALSMPAFMRYDSTLAARFGVTRHKRVTLVNQNALLTQYPGGLGGKIGWTVRAEATYIGMARRDGITLIVTILHCKPLTEITSAERLLNWGFAMAGKVPPVGLLVPPQPAATVVPDPRRGAPRHVPGGVVAARTGAGAAAPARAGPADTGRGALTAGAFVAAVLCVALLGRTLRGRPVRWRPVRRRSVRRAGAQAGSRPDP